MKKFSEIKPTDNDTIYAIFDMEDIMWCFYYDKKEAEEEMNKLQKKTPSLKFRIETMKNSDIQEMPK